MIDTIHLLPPDVGPRSNPVLFGVATVLAERLPLTLAAPCAAEPMRARPCASPGEGTGRALARSPVRIASTEGA